MPGIALRRPFMSVKTLERLVYSGKEKLMDNTSRGFISTVEHPGQW